jgi:hypothetical protein
VLYRIKLHHGFICCNKLNYIIASSPQILFWTLPSMCIEIFDLVAHPPPADFRSKMQVGVPSPATPPLTGGPFKTVHSIFVPFRQRSQPPSTAFRLQSKEEVGARACFSWTGGPITKPHTCMCLTPLKKDSSPSWPNGLYYHHQHLPAPRVGLACA